MLMRFAIAAALLAALSACGSERYDPFAKHGDFRSHCRSALQVLAARDPDKTRFSVENTSATERGDTMAATIVYLQGESRRLFTCLYNPNQPNRIIGGSYRGQPLTQAQIDDINANVR
jgi:hypothetical protein